MSVSSSNCMKRVVMKANHLGALIIIYYYYDYSAWPLGRAVHLFTCFSSRGLASRVFLKLKVPAARMFVLVGQFYTEPCSTVRLFIII